MMFIKILAIIKGLIYFYFIFFFYKKHNVMTYDYS